MKSKIFLICLFSLLFYGCLIFPRKNEIGVHWIKNPDITTIPVFELYEVLTNNFLNYTVVLSSMPAGSTIILPLEKKRLYTDPHNTITMTSHETHINIQYTIDNTKPNSPATGIIIRYFLKGKDQHARLFELTEPMEKIKTILINHFQLIQGENFNEQFIPYPIY